MFIPTTTLIQRDQNAGVVGFGVPLDSVTLGDMWVPHAASTTYTLTAPDTDYGQPLLLLLSPITVDQMSVKVSTPQVGAHVRLAIYKANSAWYPTTLAVDAGTVDASGSGVVNALFTGVQLPAGRYIAMAAPDASAVDVVLVAYGGPDPFGPVLATSNFITIITNGRAYAAFPDPYPAGMWTSFTATTAFKFFIFPTVHSSP